VQATGDQKFWDTNEDDFVRIYRVYDKFLDDGLIKQGRAADWQDSVTRVGKAFFTNLIFWTVTDRLQSNPKFQIPAGYAAQLKQRIIETFKDPESGLYFTMETGSQISLEGLLFAIDWGFDSADSADGKALYASLKKHPLWAGGKSGIPGFATYPNYDESAVEPMPKLSGVRHYHDEIYWSWLIALSAKIAFTMNDPSEGNRILSRLEQLAQRDGAVDEVFWPEANLPKVKTAVYRAEIPFSWGSSITLEALNAQKNFK
jgi:hypothetical protein